VSERFWKTDDCCSTTADVTYSAKVDFDNANGDLSGVEVVFKRDGTEVGRANTGSDGFASFTEQNVARGPHSITVCVAETQSSGTGSGTGSHGTSAVPGDNPPPSNPPVDPPKNPFPDCGCGKENTCLPCVDSPADGWFCSSVDFAVYTDCIKGSITGTGYFPTCNPCRVGLRDAMSFRIAYDNGAVQGYLNFSDGPSSPWKLDNAQVKWAAIVGTESWFGGDNFMVHVIDAGLDFTQDSFEIWLYDPTTCQCYHCGGKLTGCYVHVSYKYTAQCP
jgi:hypothetical protein